MGFKIRKSFKLAPSLKINLSKSGISTSISKAGATVNIGKNGIKSTVGIPGTGISHTQNHSTKNKGATTETAHIPNRIVTLTSVFLILIVACVLF